MFVLSVKSVVAERCTDAKVAPQYKLNVSEDIFIDVNLNIDLLNMLEIV